MASQYTIQLREAEDTTDHNKGEFSVPLKKDLFLEQGDSIVVRQTFLDCEADGKVRVANADPYDTTDVNFSITFGTYVTNTLPDVTADNGSYAHMYGFEDSKPTGLSLTLFAEAAKGATELKFTNTSNPGGIDNDTKGVVEVADQLIPVVKVSIGTGDDSTIYLADKLSAIAASGSTVKVFKTGPLVSPDYQDYVLMTMDSTPGTKMTVASVAGKVVTMNAAVPSNVKADMFLRGDDTITNPPANVIPESINQITKIDGAHITCQYDFNTSNVQNGTKLTALYLGTQVEFWRNFELRIPALTMPGTYFFASWVDMNNVEQYKQIEASNQELWTEYTDFYMNVYVKAGTAKVNLDNTGLSLNRSMNLLPVNGGAGQESHLCFPKYRTINFTLPVGYYSQDEMCKKMNDKIQGLANIGVVTDIGSNLPTLTSTGTKLLIASNQLDTDFADEQLLLVRTDGLRYLRNGQNPYWIGAPELAVFYDDDSGSFGFERMHLSLYSSGSSAGVEVGIIGVAGNNTAGDGSDDSAGQMSFVGKAGGVFIVDLEPKNVWAEQMGFSGTMGPVLDRGQGTKVFFNSKTVFKLNPILVGDLDTHTTQMFASASGFMNQNPPAKNGNNDVGAGDKSVLKKFDDGSPYEVAGSSFTQIFASESVDRTSSQTVPYLQVELLGLPNVQHSAVATKSVAQVVGKYYSTGRYVSSSGEGTAYTHLGAPIQISKLGCRILNPDFSLAETGGDSTVFLEVVKAQPQKPQK